VTEVRAAAERIRVRMKRTAEDIIEIGRDLLAVKTKLGHGNFLPWIEAEFGMSQRTAYNFMAVSEKLGDKVATVANFAPKALYLLASAPAEVVTQVETKAEAGETVSVAEVTRAQVRRIVAIKGWAALPPRRVRAMVISEIGNGSEADAALALLDRIRKTPELLLEPANFDLLPPDIRAKLRQGMRKLLDELGVRYRIDDAGELWPDAEQLADKLGVDPEDVIEMSRQCPPPVGRLHMLQ
jgi:hypothetical protein